MNKEFIKTEEQRHFYESAEKLNDRELQELQAFYAKQNKENTDNIKNNIKFFFYLTIVSIAAAIIISINSN